MNVKKVALAGAGAAAVGMAALAVGVSNADASSPAAPSSAGYASTAPAGPGSGEGSGQGTDTDVTGDELAKVTAAVVAKDSAVTVTSVRKDADGSYDVFGTKAGASVRYEVSTDLATITADTNGGGQGKGGGGGNDTPVTGDEAAKASAAVTAKDSAVTVTSVRKDPDGSYDVLGTKAGANVMFDVSADLATVTQSGSGGAGAKPGGATSSGTSTGTA